MMDKIGKTKSKVVRYGLGFGVSAVAVAALILGAASSVSAQKFKIGPAPVEPKPGTYKTGTIPGNIEAGKAVYFRKCVWCHGPDGAGDGPSAIRLATKPRNFNQGTFKIRHTGSGELPTDEDLFNSITHGLSGSVMPPWGAKIGRAHV